MTKRSAGLAATFTITIALGTTGFAREAELKPALTVCLTLSDEIDLEAPLRAAIVSEANRVWQPMDVAVSMRDEAERACNRFLLVKAGHEAGPEDKSSEAAIAWVPFTRGWARQVVFVRVDRARMLIDAFSPNGTSKRPPGLTEQLLAKLLGRSLAHELGHVLLNSTKHERSGLMRARYEAHDVLRDLPSAYTLSPAQRERLHALRILATRTAAR